MRIRVSYDSEVLGSKIFWEGDSSDMSKLQNIPARMLVQQVAQDGKTRSSGMWTAKKIKGEYCEICDKFVEGFEYKLGCDIMNQPEEPCACSKDCYDVITKLNKKGGAKKRAPQGY